jgi:hypothetical protein
MRFDISKGDYELLCSVLKLLREKGGKNPSITRTELVRESGVTNSHLSKKIFNLHLKEKQLKERIA